MQFAIVVITKDEEKGIIPLLESLKTFIAAGGQVVIADTGSTDNTRAVTEEHGCHFVDIGTEFTHTVDRDTAANVNAFLEDQTCVDDGDVWFHFANARNRASQETRHTHILMLDARDYLISFEWEIINAMIKHTSAFYYTHVLTERGDTQQICRFYDKTKFYWHGGAHEYLERFDPSNWPANRTLSRSIMTVGHRRNENRQRQYFVPLVLDLQADPTMHRWYYYLGRELYYANYWQRASEILKQGVKECTEGWNTEQSDAMCIAARCEFQRGFIDNAKDCLREAILIDPLRRSPWLLLASISKMEQNYEETIRCALEALKINKDISLTEPVDYYRALPHHYLYWAFFYLGDYEKAKQHHARALEYEPDNEQFLQDLQFFKS